MLSLLELLADCQPHSFEKLTALLTLNDEQLFAEIQQLQAQGVQIDTSYGNVKIMPQTALLSAVKIQQVFAQNKVIYRPIIHSTNQLLLANIGRLNKGDICITEHQTAGRGRRGRQWQSPFASLAMFSLIWQVDAHKPLDGLSLVVGMAIYEGLRKLGAKGVMLKWPNDVLLDGRKLAGILIEIANTEEGKINLVIGVGMNVAMPKEENQIDQPWANLNEILPKIDRTLLICTLLEEIFSALNEFEQQGISAEFRQKWLERDAFWGEEVNIITEKETISGIEQGIDERGYLRLAVNNGEQWLSFNGGEVSLRRKIS
ncbi:BirA family biotin operon repressor/biotin-[acetyl-CoA-carboxylase] ligase [Pasteurella langaaensis DSM 22999]|uniref:biotin--[biotin carboxyl-carrier protein] ligase n=1 Tax=Alitibacter langaaensis DSM 22999 TaxID=1122935 RepID=A0A2U0TAA7_9PAST|nr:bifunctional biotin--[acetyl-CoA-carboxylase] ligase/biotin operon repressor BirA [Pasteurella langaaensis]PVX40508.1 BirA family biotin operon repressor/biotin-[acetyl-CoA-carboxylase] ligase [Pasteurella langaaensis DSM 22999]